jgi:hypothetical protein
MTTRLTPPAAHLEPRLHKDRRTFMEKDIFLHLAKLGIITVTVRGQENVYGTIEDYEVYTKPGNIEQLMAQAKVMPEHDICPSCGCNRTRDLISYFMICPSCDHPRATHNPPAIVGG